MADLMSSVDQDYLVLEAGGTRHLLRDVPRHGQLLSINRRFNIFPERDFNLRHDWNSLLSDDPEKVMTRYSTELFPHRDELVQYLRTLRRLSRITSGITRAFGAWSATRTAASTCTPRTARAISATDF